jgi:hypothetical protein
MKRHLSFSIFIIILVFSLVNSGLAQECFDQGQPDTLYFAAAPPCSDNGDTLFVPPGGGFVRIQLNIWNDNSLTAVSIPVIDSLFGPENFAFMDYNINNSSVRPLAFAGSRVLDQDWETLIVNFSLYPPKVKYSALLMTAPPLPPGDGLLASMIYTVTDTGRICVDTTFFPPA